MKIILTGGGTAGHVSGNMALVPSLKKHRFQIDYIGTKRGMEKDITAKDPDIIYHPISAGRLNRSITLENVRDAFRVLKGLNDAEKLIKEIKPDIVFSKGGFVTVPVVVAAHIHKIPVIIHESDYTLGLANKLSARFADKVCTTFPETAAAYHSDKYICTGSPLRQDLFTGSREKGLELCGFDGKKPVLIIMGGSLGARAINELVKASVSTLVNKFDIIHIYGKSGTDPDLEGIRGYKQFGYVSEELRHLFAASDLAVSRAGSNSIFEFLAAKKPMLLIPLPKGESRGDQILNAQSFAKSGYALSVDQDELDSEKFIYYINRLSQESSRIKSAMNASQSAEGTDTILDLIYSLSGKNNKTL